MRIFPIFIVFSILFNAPVPVYGLMPSSIEEIEEDLTPGEIEQSIEEVKKLKQEIMEHVTPLREERERSLHPFVQKKESENYDTFPSEVEDRRVRYVGPPQIEKEIPQQPVSSQKTASKTMLNLIFFSIIALGFLASHLFIRPKP
ncbi:MAG: hypothetical protein KKD11_03525 [Candidatus Omnitrophica bacterium]|nr:hypothetical protein [Candidatus Omnitrophota bacterium]